MCAKLLFRSVATKRTGIALCSRLHLATPTAILDVPELLKSKILQFGPHQRP